MFLLPPLHGDFRGRLEGHTHTAPVGTASLVGLLAGSVLSVGRLVELDSRERDPSRGPLLEAECVLTSSRVNVLGVPVVSTLIMRGIRKDRVHPDEHIRPLPHLDGKEGRTSVVALLLPEERVVAKVVGALLRTEKRPLTRSQSLVSCS
jgi:hypothetical protein